MLAAAFTYIRNQGDAWSVTQEALNRDLEAFALLPRDEAGALVGPPPPFEYPLDLGSILGKRTAELHVAFATPTRDRRFAAEPIQAADLKRWAASASRNLTAAFGIVAQAARQAGEPLKADAAALRKARAAIQARVKVATGLTEAGLKTRTHGDYHLVQILAVKDDVAIIDFEDESRPAGGDRHRKVSPLRDIASMLRSFDNAAWSAISRIEERDGASAPVRERALAWRDAITRDFLAAYWPVAGAGGVVPQDEAARRCLLDLFLINKASDEIAQEAARRPAWLSLPIRAVLALAAADEVHP